MSFTRKFEKLPSEILHSIYLYLNFADLLLVAQSSWTLYRSVCQPSVLKKAICVIGNDGFQRSMKLSFPQRHKALKITKELVNRLETPLSHLSILSTRGWCDINMNISELLFPKLKNLIHLDLLGNQELDDTLLRLVLTHCKKLTHLNLSHCPRLTQKSVFLLCSNASECTLSWLNLSSTQCITNKAWVVLCATQAECLEKLYVSSCYSSISFDIMRSYPRNATYLDFSRNDTLTFGFLEAIAIDRQQRRKPPKLTIDIRDCDGITGDEITLLESISGFSIRFLSNPKLSSNDERGVREYISRLIAL